MQYISILDYSTNNNLVIEDEGEITKDLQNEDIEEMLEGLGFHMSNCNYMVSDEDPGQGRTTLRELAEEHYDEIEAECIKRLRGAEDNG